MNIDTIRVRTTEPGIITVWSDWKVFAIKGTPEEAADLASQEGLTVTKTVPCVDGGELTWWYEAGDDLSEWTAESESRGVEGGLSALLLPALKDRVSVARGAR